MNYEFDRIVPDPLLPMESWIHPLSDGDIVSFFIRRHPMPLPNPSKQVQSTSMERMRVWNIMMPIFENLPIIARSFAHIYSSLSAEWFHAHPPTIVVYAAGGRVKGTPISASSDIDIIFASENQNMMVNQPYDTFHASSTFDHAIDAKQQLIKTHCSAYLRSQGLHDMFHIIDFGAPIPKRQSPWSPVIYIGSGNAQIC
jgi:hypothetical protein